MATLHEPIAFVIPLAPVTKKNSQRIVHLGQRCPKCKRGMHAKPLPSEAFQRYEEEAYRHMPRNTDTVDWPVNVKAIYYMKTRRAVDLTNLHEALHDVLVKYHVVSDDSNRFIISTDGSRVRYSKDNPRTEVLITEAVDEDCQVDLFGEMEVDW